MTNKTKTLALTSLLFLTTALLFFFAKAGGLPLQESSSQEVMPSSSSQPQEEVKEESEASEIEAPPPISLRLVAAGDNLIHDNIYKQAQQRAGGEGFDFAPVYENIEHMIEGADIAFFNQETPLAQNIAPLAGYPRFNSPDEIGHHMERLGFNVITYANNHMFDKGEEGLYETMKFWDNKPDILHMGAWRNVQEESTPVIFEKDGIKIGFVAVTEHTNGLNPPSDTEISYLLSSDTEGIKKQVELAQENSDFVIISIHWGTENSVDKNTNQITLAQMFADWGVDLVIGHHSHTVQPVEWVEGQDGNRMLITYSLGNLISSMLNPQNFLGAFLDIDITKDFVTNETKITRAEIKPIVGHYDGAQRGQVRVYPFEQYTHQLASQHGVAVKYPYFGLDFFKEIITDNIPSEFRPNLVMEWDD